VIAVDEIEHQMNTTQLYSSTVQYSTIKLYSFITYRMMTMQCLLLTKRKCTVGKNYNARIPDGDKCEDNEGHSS